MRVSSRLGLAVAMVGNAADAAELDCGRYASLNRLPIGFDEIASAQLSAGEFFVLTDKTCTCDNKPAVDRRLGRPAPVNVNWSSRPASLGERRSD